MRRSHGHVAPNSRAAFGNQKPGRINLSCALPLRPCSKKVTAYFSLLGSVADNTHPARHLGSKVLVQVLMQESGVLGY